MRHVMSGLAGLVATPVVWAVFGYGSYLYRMELIRAPELGGVAVLWMLLILLAGAVLGAVAMLRTSPVGPLIMAGTYLLVTLWHLLDPVSLFRVLSWPGRMAGLSARSGAYSLSDPVYTGTLTLIGAALMITVFSRQRWLAWPRGATPARPVPGAPFPPGAPAMPGPGMPGPMPGPVPGAAAPAAPEPARPEAPGEGGSPDQSAGSGSGSGSGSGDSATR
ncbi:MAG: hypothetical protein ACRDT4_22150 [Micromonosporaceae bacterium]